jgi:hypothetical protein
MFVCDVKLYDSLGGVIVLHITHEFGDLFQRFTIAIDYKIRIREIKSWHVHHAIAVLEHIPRYFNFIEY